MCVCVRYTLRREGEVVGAIRTCVCVHACVCVLIPSLSAPFPSSPPCFPEEQAPDSPLAACTGQGVVENLPCSISEPAEFWEQKVFYAKNQVLRCKDVL